MKNEDEMNRINKMLSIADFILFMESGDLIEITLENPFFPTFSYYNAKGYKVHTSDSGKGPFQMTNAFEKDYYPKGADYAPECTKLLERMYALHGRTINIPLYFIQCLYGWVDRFDLFDENDYTIVYDRYFMPDKKMSLNDKQISRVNDYVTKYRDQGTFWLKVRSEMDYT